jgi:hypothetical protein
MKILNNRPISEGAAMDKYDLEELDAKRDAEIGDMEARIAELEAAMRLAMQMIDDRFPEAAATTLRQALGK